MKIFGIKNCDKIKKTIIWCAQNQKKCFFHDYRVDGLDQDLLDIFLSQYQIEDLVNKRSTTWRNLSDDQKSQVSTDMIIEHPTLLKRPIVIINDRIMIGYFPEKWI